MNAHSQYNLWCGQVRARVPSRPVEHPGRTSQASNSTKVSSALPLRQLPAPYSKGCEGLKRPVGARDEVQRAPTLPMSCTIWAPTHRGGRISPHNHFFHPCCGASLRPRHRRPRFSFEPWWPRPHEEHPFGPRAFGLRGEFAPSGRPTEVGAQRALLVWVRIQVQEMPLGPRR